MPPGTLTPGPPEAPVGEGGGERESCKINQFCLTKPYCL